MQSYDWTLLRPQQHSDAASSWVQERYLGTQLQEGCKRIPDTSLSLRNKSLVQKVTLAKLCRSDRRDALRLNEVQSVHILRFVAVSACRCRRSAWTVQVLQTLGPASTDRRRRRHTACRQRIRAQPYTKSRSWTLSAKRRKSRHDEPRNQM